MRYLQIKKKLIIFRITTTLVIAPIVWIAWGNQALERNTHRVTNPSLPDGFDGFRIAPVSNLHNTEKGAVCRRSYQNRPELVLVELAC